MEGRVGVGSRGKRRGRERRMEGSHEEEDLKERKGMETKGKGKGMVQKRGKKAERKEGEDRGKFRGEGKM